MIDNDPFIELPLHYGDGKSILIRRSRVVMLEPAERHTDRPEGERLQGTDLWFRLSEGITAQRFIPLSPQEVMARLDQREEPSKE